MNVSIFEPGQIFKDSEGDRWKVASNRRDAIMLSGDNETNNILTIEYIDYKYGPLELEDSTESSDASGSSEYDEITRPSHYTDHPSGVECRDIAQWFTYNIGSAFGYLWRAGKKIYSGKTSTQSAITDYLKAINFIQAEIERLNGIEGESVEG